MTTTRTYEDDPHAKDRLIVLLIKKLGGRVMIPTIELMKDNEEVLLHMSLSYPEDVITFGIKETK